VVSELVTMTDYYHYTDDAGAQSIIRSTKILASLSFMTNGDTAFGNGVYLTKMDPETNTKDEIAKNNWNNTSAAFIEKTRYYFVIKIPDAKIKDATSNGREIFLYGRSSDLSLLKYPWWLMDTDSGQIISSYKYTVASLGSASSEPSLGIIFGDYLMSDETINGRPVYKHKYENFYLSMNSCGVWIVGLGDDAGNDKGWIVQDSTYSLGPDPISPWGYLNADGKIFSNDATLKAYPWQK